MPSGVSEAMVIKGIEAFKCKDQARLPSEKLCSSRRLQADAVSSAAVAARGVRVV